MAATSPGKQTVGRRGSIAAAAHPRNERDRAWMGRLGSSSTTAHNDNIYVYARGCKLQINKRESSLLVKWKIWIETKTTTVIDLGSIYNLSPSLFTTLSPLAITNTRHYYTKRAYLRVQNDCQVINDHLSNSSSCLIRGQTRKRLLSSSPSGVPQLNSTQLQRSIQSLPPKVNIILRPLPLPL